MAGLNLKYSVALLVTLALPVGRRRPIIASQSSPGNAIIKQQRTYYAMGLTPAMRPVQACPWYCSIGAGMWRVFRVCGKCHSGSRSALVRCTAACLLIFALSSEGFAKNYGVHGPLWEVAEPSLIDSIKARLGEMQANGELDQMRQEMQDRTRAYANRPTPIEGLLPAELTREYEVDLSITLNRDLSDHRGQVFARKGTHINPLHYSRFDQRIVVIDGDNAEQVAFALERGNELDTLLVLVNGAPLELMRAHGRRFYFDQHGQIVNRFGLSRLPSEITRAGEVMRVREVALGEGAGQ